jgi:hypothetical protein
MGVERKAEEYNLGPHTRTTLGFGLDRQINYYYKTVG